MLAVEILNPNRDRHSLKVDLSKNMVVSLRFKREFIICVVLLIVFSCQVAFCSEAAKITDPQAPITFAESIKNLINKIDFSTAVKATYDSNIFLTEDNEDSDIINTLTQGLVLKLPNDPFYLQLDYTGNLSYYLEEADTLSNHSANFLASYRPFDYFSFGIGNSFKKMNSKKITTAFVDRLLSRGYVADTPMFQLKIEPSAKWMIESSWEYYYLDADSSSDDYIDRGDNTETVAFNYEFWPELTGFFGCRHQDAHFPHLSTKDADSYKGFFGFKRKFDKFNLNAQVGQEHKETNFQSNDSNTDFQISANSTFSVFTLINIAFTFNKSEPSARKEYFQYFKNGVEISFWRLLTPKLSLLTNFSYEKQKFDAAHALSGNYYVDKTTTIYSFGSSLIRRINDTLSLDFGYSFMKRNTDFASEGHTDNKISFGITASY